MTTSTTSSAASNSVSMTELIDCSHEHGRVVDDLPGQAGREARRELGHPRADLVRQLDDVRARRLEDADPTACLLSSSERSEYVAGAELDARDIAEPRELAVRAGA